MSGSLQSPNEAQQDTEAEELISVARIARPHGLKGEVIADLLTDFPDRFARLKAVCIKRPGGEKSTLKLDRFRLHLGRVVLKFAGYDSIDQAEELRDAQVMITRHELVKLPASTYYDFDLIGCEVSTTEGRRVGRVTAVQNYGAAPLLVVKDEAQREYLIPLVLSICTEIEIDAKRIVVNPPEGLLELADG